MASLSKSLILTNACQTIEGFVTEKIKRFGKRVRFFGKIPSNCFDFCSDVNKRQQKV